MLRCKKCSVPLDGFLAVIGKAFFNIKPSVKDPQICNKCIGNKTDSKIDTEEYKPKGGKYKCQICSRMIHEEQALEHVKAEEYLINLIRRDHPQWEHRGPTCPECINYYRRLVNEAEI